MWDHLAEAKDAYPKIRMIQIKSPDLKKMLQLCSGRVLLLFHSSLYRVLNLTFLTDVGGIVSDGRITTDIGTGSLGQYVRVQTPADFCPICV